MTAEPILRAEDHRAWEQWMRAVHLHQRSLDHARAVDRARREVERAAAAGAVRSVALSGGKDSSDLAHIVCVDRGIPAVVVSEKDDLDYPGEEAYVRGLAVAWGLDLRIVHPATSPTEWIARRAAAMSGGEDIHGRSAGLSKACFYNVMEETDAEVGAAVTFWGLRAEESGRRRALLTAKGTTYQLKSGVTRCHPLGWWRGIDVYAYAEAVGLELLPVYRCCGWLPEHRRDPSRIRKSWWLPGKQAAKGQVAWLRRYYPSLWERYRIWFPDAASFV